MDSSTLITLYQQPSQCSDEQMQNLSEYIAQHPYMTFALVLQQKINQEKNPKFKRADHQKKSILLSPNSSTSFFYLTEVEDAEQTLNQSDIEDIEAIALVDLPVDVHIEKKKESVEEALNYSYWLKLALQQKADGFAAQPKTELPQQAQSELDEKIENIQQFIKKTKHFKISKDRLQANSKDLSKQHLVENPDFTTETLAQIYEDQGLYTKAIQAYRILSLKNPEKSSFFADRIKNIQELKIKKS
ncbi:MAG: hypothetical protein ACPGEC_00050 [Flavobacteriales bacterium]